MREHQFSKRPAVRRVRRRHDLSLVVLVVLVVVLALVLAACGSETESTTTTDGSQQPADLIVLDYEFISGSDGWAADVSDFSDATRPDDVLAQTGEAPEDFDPDDGFFHLAATNRSDDLFHFMYREITSDDGLAPNTTYEVSYIVEFASNAPSGCVGVGGSPGESVWLKVGASPVRPDPVREDGETRLRIDKGGQSEGGSDAEVAGVVANGIPCEEALSQDPTPYAMVTLEHTLGFDVTTDEDASLWLVVGTDSGFEAGTSIFYDSVEVTLTREP